jgi:hypothetical protein
MMGNTVGATNIRHEPARKASAAACRCACRPRGFPARQPDAEPLAQRVRIVSSAPNVDWNRKGNCAQSDRRSYMFPQGRAGVRQRRRRRRAKGGKRREGSVDARRRVRSIASRATVIDIAPGQSEATDNLNV